MIVFIKERPLLYLHRKNLVYIVELCLFPQLSDYEERKCIFTHQFGADEPSTVAIHPSGHQVNCFILTFP